MDSFKSTPPLVPIQLESTPPGADATTSLGPGCKTPCTVSVPAPDAGFTVTFNLPRFLPATVMASTSYAITIASALTAALTAEGVAHA